MSSSDSSDGEPSTKRKEEIASTSKFNSEEGTESGYGEPKVLNLENTSNILNQEGDGTCSESNSNLGEKTETLN